MVDEISDSFSIVPLISPMAPTACSVAAWIAAICSPISSVALAVCSASAFTSEATTAKSAPGFARARRLDGGVERQQVGLLGDRVISLTTSPMRLAAFDSSLMR